MLLWIIITCQISIGDIWTGNHLKCIILCFIPLPNALCLKITSYAHCFLSLCIRVLKFFSFTLIDQ